VQYGPDGPPDHVVPVSIGGITLVLSMLLMFRILRRARRESMVASGPMAEAEAHALGA
jgi:hypothetical protein